MKWAKELNWFNSTVPDSSFISSSEDFVNNKKRGLIYIKNAAVPWLGGGETIISSEVIYQKNSRLEKFKNSKILIVGGGPSTDENNWNPEEYDFVWSTNHFFMNEKIKKVDIALANLGGAVHFSACPKSDHHSQKVHCNCAYAPPLHEYLENHDTILCFENFSPEGNWWKKLGAFKKKYGDRVFWAHTRYHSKIGAIPRLVSIAVLLGAKEIHIVGMDGLMLERFKDRLQHSFLLPTWEERKPVGTLEQLGEEEATKKYLEQYLAFWDYHLHDIGKDVKFKNLGHGHPCNMSTNLLTEILGEEYQDYLYDPNLRVEQK